MPGEEFVSLDELLAAARTPGRAAALRRRASAAEEFPWDLVLGAVLDRADAMAVIEILGAIGHLGPPLHVHAWFAGRLAALGRVAEARAATDRAWEGSKPHGWTESYDGGTRLVAADAEILVNGERGRQRVFGRMIRDYVGESRHPGMLLRELHRLVALLFADPPLEAIWAEIAEHVGQLAEVAMSIALEPPAPPASVEDASSALGDLAFDDLDHPARELADAARKFLLDLIREPENRLVVGGRVAARLADDNDDAKQESTLALLLCALDVDPKWTGIFAEDVRRAGLASSSAIVGAHVERLLECLELPAPIRGRRPLPVIHALRLPPPPMPGVGSTSTPRRGEPLEDTEDPVDLAGSLEAPLARIAARSGIPLRNLMIRLSKLMPDVSPKTLWDRAAEKRLQADLESAGLRIAYRRPRTAVARLAFGRLVRELEDGAAITRPASDLDRWLVAFDPLVSTLDASERPLWLDPPEAAGMNAWSDKGWTGRPEDCLANAPLLLPDGSLVLAERTEWVKTDHGRPTEVRATQVGPHGYPWDSREEPEDGFFLLYPRGATGAEYPIMWPQRIVVPMFPVLE